METLLGILAFAAFLVAQIAAVITVSAHRQGYSSETSDARLDHLARLIRNSGD
jgi:hypothetical protein